MALMDRVEMLFDNPALAIVNAVVLALVGFNHITNPGSSLVAGLVPGLPNVLYQIAGVLVGGSGVMQLVDAARNL